MLLQTVNSCVEKVDNVGLCRTRKYILSPYVKLLISFLTRLKRVNLGCPVNLAAEDVRLSKWNASREYLQEARGGLIGLIESIYSNTPCSETARG